MQLLTRAEQSFDSSRALGLYSQAVLAIVPAEFECELRICRSALQRRGLSAQNVHSAAQLDSIAQMLLDAMGGFGELLVVLQNPDPLVISEALELCLAGLSFDIPTRLQLRAPVFGAFAASQTPISDSVKGYLSLSMFGLEHAEVSAHDAAPISAQSLILPWQTLSETGADTLVLTL